MTCKACGAADVRAYQCGGENVRYHCEPCGHVWTDPPIRVSTREHRLMFVPASILDRPAISAGHPATESPQARMSAASRAATSGPIRRSA